MNVKRKTVLATVDVLVDVGSITKLTDLRIKIDAWIAKYGPTAALDIQVTGYDGYLEAEVQFERPETDAELRLREKELAKEKASRLEADKKKMVQLQKLAKDLGVAIKLPATSKGQKILS